MFAITSYNLSYSQSLSIYDYGEYEDQLNIGQVQLWLTLGQKEHLR